MCRTPTQLLLLNSKDRQTGTINNATYKLGIPMVKISKARLENFTILNSFYAISATNGSFTVAESLGPTAVITIPPGTYDTVQFAAAIQAQLNAAGLGNTYTVTVDPVTLKLEIEATAGALDPVERHPAQCGGAGRTARWHGSGLGQGLRDVLAVLPFDDRPATGRRGYRTDGG